MTNNNQLQNDDVPVFGGKLLCDHCGKIIDSGIINCINHNLDDCIKEKVPMGNFTAVYRPYMSFTPVSSLSPDQLTQAREKVWSEIQKKKTPE